MRTKYGIGVYAATAVLVIIIGCMGVPGGGTDTPTDGDDNDDQVVAESRHQIILTEIITEGYQGTQTCLICHTDEAEDIVETGHWKWKGTSANIQGYETGTHGKVDLINNFCIAIPSNEGRCTQCHAGYGWADNTFDFTDMNNIDCLVCHDTTGTYQKAPTTAGLPADTVDLQTVAQNIGEPSRKNCGDCHFYAGGGDNVKHGDLSSDLVSPTREMDVHMGGKDFACQTCHKSEDHGIAGMALHSLDEGTASCTKCHDAENTHDQAVLNLHLKSVACEACHLPAFARTKPTKVEWYWDEAGQNVDPIPTDEFGQATYDKKKGRFVWDMNVRPTLMWFNGKWERMIIGENDQYTTTPVEIAKPVGSFDDPDSKLYPFKKMVGRQPADKNNKTMLVPHLFGKKAGDNPFWGVYDWGLALAEGAAYAGQTYSGEYEFVDTVMYLKVSHEIAPAENALDCEDCHNGGIDFVALGYPQDPWNSSPRD